MKTNARSEAAAILKVILQVRVPKISVWRAALSAALLLITAGNICGASEPHGAAGANAAATPAAAASHDSAPHASGAGSVSAATAVHDVQARQASAHHEPVPALPAAGTSYAVLAIVGVTAGLLAFGVYYASRRRSIAVRLFANPAVLLLFLSGMAGYAWTRFDDISHRLTIIAQDDLPILANLADAEARMLEQALALSKLDGPKADQWAATFTKLAHEVEEELSLVEKEIEHAIASSTDDVERAEFAQLATEARQIHQAHQAFDTAGEKFIAARKARQSTAAIAEEIEALELRMRTEFGRAIEYTKNQALHEAEISRAEAHDAEQFIVFVSLMAFVIGVTFTVTMSRALSRQLAGTAHQIDANAQQTAAASGQVACASQTLAEGASEQAASLEETSAALEELTSMVKRNADSAGQAQRLAGESRSAADRSAVEIAELQTAMSDIQESSMEIAKIVKSIDEIAFQTNILALNAAVEAARAGDAGMGFAVVADEVRNLAQRSAMSARETSEKIEAAITKSQRGVEIGARVSESFQQIATQAREVDRYVSEIAIASQEQAQGVQQINQAISQLDQVTQGNAASSEESASASTELNAQALSMREAVVSLMVLVNGAGKATSTTTAGEAAGPSPARTSASTTPTRPVAQQRLVQPSAPAPVASTPERATQPVSENADAFKSF